MAPAVLPADLTVSGFDVSSASFDAQSLDVSGTVSATLTNIGEGDVSAPLIELAIFEDRNANARFVADNSCCAPCGPISGRIVPLCFAELLQDAVTIAINRHQRRDIPGQLLGCTGL